MLNFKIIGGDHREYGPVTQEELAQWIREGRANLDTLIQEEGTGQWKPLRAFPELAAIFGQQFPSQAGEEASLRRAESAAHSGVELDIGSCLREGWQLIARQFGAVLLGTLTIWVIDTGLDFVPIIGGLVAMIVRGFLYGGLYRYFLGLIRGQEPDLGGMFKVNAVQLILAGIVTSLLVQIGLLLCLIPGIFFLVAWKFTLALVADKEVDFWTAMEWSRKVVTPRWFQLCGLLIVAFLPTMLCTAYIDYRLFTEVIQIWDQGKGLDLARLETVMKMAVPLMLLYKVVWLINLPWAVAPLMVAYERLFGEPAIERPAAASTLGPME